MTTTQSTAARVLAGLVQYDLKQQANGEYRCNSPFRAGSNSHALSVRIHDDEHGTYKDHVTGEAGSLYLLAAKLGIDTVQGHQMSSGATSKRVYAGLDDYAHAHGVQSTVFTAVGWKQTRHQSRPALEIPVATGSRHRYLDGNKPEYKNPLGYKACWYYLVEAVQLAQATAQPLVICNGEASTVVAQHYNVAACAIPGGEPNVASYLQKGLLGELQAAYSGSIIVAFDCDQTGRDSALETQDVLAKAGYKVRAVDLNGGSGFDLADFCSLYMADSAVDLQNLLDLDTPLPLPQPSAVMGNSPKNLDRDIVITYLDQEEAGDSQLLHALFQGKLVYDYAAEQWYEFESHAWKALDTPPRRLVWSAVASAYLNLAADLQAQTATATSAQKAKLTAQVDELTARARKLRHLNRVNNTLTFAQELLGVSGEAWDADPWLLGVANGVLDLRTGQLRDGQPQDYIRTVAPTAWKGLDVSCLRWERFVSEIMSDEADRVAFLQRLLGYALNGSTKEHVLGMFVGERGRNGKRVLFEALQYVLGDYAKSMSTDVLVGQDHMRSAGSAQPHLMELQGSRIAYCSETKEHDALSAAQVKNITGGDPITARWLHANPVTFIPTHTLFLQTNRKPQAPADDDALWERVKVIEFKVRFVDAPNTLDERPRDLKLEETLQAEVSGILAWLVRGGLDWQRSGLQTPASVRLARDTYRKGESVDPFLDDCCDEWDGGSTEGGVLNEAYKTWCKLRSLQPKSTVWLGKQLAQRFEKGRITTAGPNAGRTVYYGVTLREQKDWSAAASAEETAILQSAINPSISIGTPNDDTIVEGIEGLRSILKSFHAESTHEEKNMTNPSIPSIPSIDIIEQEQVIHLGTDPEVTATLDVNDQAIESRLQALVNAKVWPQARDEAQKLHNDGLRAKWLHTIDTSEPRQQLRVGRAAISKLSQYAAPYTDDDNLFDEPTDVALVS